MFLYFKLFTTEPQQKLCLPEWFTISYMVIEEILLPATFVTEWTLIGNCKMSDFFFWLIFLVNSLSSLTTLRFPHSSSMNTNQDKSSRFQMSSISVSFSSSSAIKVFLKGCLQWNHDFCFFFENRTRKIKQVSICERSLFFPICERSLDFISYLFL